MATANEPALYTAGDEVNQWTDFRIQGYHNSTPRTVFAPIEGVVKPLLPAFGMVEESLLPVYSWTVHMSLELKGLTH